MRTSIQIDDGLIKAIQKETTQKTLSAAIRSALEGYLEHRQKLKLIRSFGQFPRWKPDIKSMRKNRDID